MSMLLLLKPLSVGFLLLANLPIQEPITDFQLDKAGGISGLLFGSAAVQIPNFEQQFRKQGKPRLHTQLYARLKDTAQLGGLGSPTSYWFRQGKFIGIDQVVLRKPIEQALARLTNYYGQPQYDAQTKQWYWLGKHSFILLENNGHRRGSLLIGSLAMLNELVEENAMRTQARQQLGWQPDSVGLPKQLHLRH